MHALTETRPDAIFRIAVVCTGNRFRSPLTAALLRSQAHDLPVEVESLGTLDLGPIPALPEALDEARRLGVDLSDHVARQLTGADIEAADLTLGFERIHVATCVVDLGLPRERVFTLPELADLLWRIEAPTAVEPVARAHQALRSAHALRSANSALELREIADPLGRSRRDRDVIVAQVRDLTEAVFEGLFGTPWAPATGDLSRQRTR